MNQTATYSFWHPPAQGLRTALIVGALSLTGAIAHGLELCPPIAPSPAQQATGTSSAASKETVASTESPKNFWERDTLTGNWDGVRTTLADHGLSLIPSYVGEVFGNTGGARQGTIADGVFNLCLDLDLEKLTGFWKDATFHANALYIYGSSLSANDVGDFSNTSNIAGPNSIRLQEIWLEQSFWSKRASLRVGMLAADCEFFTSQSSALYLNGSFGAFTLIGANFLNAPVYPVSSPGVRLAIAPTSNFYFKAAVFSPDSDADATGNNENGTHFHIDSSDGVLVMSEIGYLLNQGPDDHGLSGSYKLGSFFQHGDYHTWQSQAAEALGTGNLSSLGTNYAVYGIADQELFKNNGKIVSVFVRGGFAPSSYSFVDRYFDAGFNFTGFVPGRAMDVAGIAVARSGVSSDFSSAQRAQGMPGSTSETVIEATYKAQINPWWTVQPDLQYVINPSGVTGSDNAFVAGVRTTLVF